MEEKKLALVQQILLDKKMVEDKKSLRVELGSLRRQILEFMTSQSSTHDQATKDWLATEIVALMGRKSNIEEQLNSSS